MLSNNAFFKMQINILNKISYTYKRENNIYLYQQIIFMK